MSAEAQQEREALAWTHSHTDNMTYEFAKPAVAVPHTDHVRLQRLAETLARRNPDLASQLSQELERAEILPDDTDRAIVRMGSTLDYQTEKGDTRTVTLVFPHDEDISAGRISILTPVGVALLGLSAGHEMEWHTRDGRTQRLQVTRIDSPPAIVADPVAVVAPTAVSVQAG
jgi:regulator of nucleoside diphosphate kinase